MTAQPLAPVIPSSGAPAARQRARSVAARRLPLASPVPVPSAPEDVVYGIARIDASGRICERAVITALGWAGGDRLTFTADAGVVTARRDGPGALPGRRNAGGGDDRSQGLRGHGCLPGERARPIATRTAGPLAKAVMQGECGGFPAQPGT